MFTPPDKLLPRTLQVIREGTAARLHFGMQVYVSLRGEVIVDFATGQNAPNQTLIPQMLCAWLSSGKPLTAVAVMQFIERQSLDLDDRVGHWIPEFATKGKQKVTIRHLLTHTAGLRPITTGWPHRSWKEIIEKICAVRLRRDWVAGQQAAYDPALSWFILGEILRRIDGRTIDQIVRQDVLEPIGMVDTWMTVPKHLHAAYGDRVGILYTLKDQQLQPTHTHSIEVCQEPSPGSSVRGPINQLGLFYETLLRRGRLADGRQLLQPETIDLMTRRHREATHDVTFDHIVDYGLGLIINSNRYGAETVPYGFGRYASPSTFGHGGAQSSIGFADPEHQLVVAVAANGCPGEQLHNERFRNLCSAIYEDLDLAGTT